LACTLETLAVSATAWKNWACVMSENPPAATGRFE
jgi:hypothetical protein